mgnify:CR=1 FL=1
MKRQKYHLKTLVSALALTLALAGPVFPGSGEGEDGSIPTPPKFPPVEEEIPETDEGDGISPLTDRDDATTKLQG